MNSGEIWTWYQPMGLGGVETFLLRMARQARIAGRTFHVAAVKATNGALQNHYAEEGLLSLDWSFFYSAYMRIADSDLAAACLARQVLSIRPSLISINACTDFGIGAAPLLRRIRPYCTILEVFHADEPDDRFLELRRPYVDLIDGIVSSNPNTLGRFQRYFRRKASIPMQYIPYGTNARPIHRTDSSDRLRLLYVGRLVQEQKRILELPPLLARLRDAGKDFRITIVGEGSDRASLVQAIDDLRLANQVVMTGYLPPERVETLYEQHDVLLNVSEYEGFSISVIEALFAGCVPACTRLPGMDEQTLIDGETALLVPIDRPNELADRIAALTPDDIVRLRGAARVRGAALTTTKMFDAYSAFTEELALRRPLIPWERAPTALGNLTWDLSAHNPWLPARPGLRGFGPRLRAFLRRRLTARGVKP